MLLRRAGVRSVVLAAAAVLTTATLAAPAEARTARGVIVIGDSLTVQAQPYLPTGWTVSGQNGREVAALPGALDTNLGEQRVPRVLVLALGQNESKGWTRDGYRAAANTVPNSTAVLFVNTYRDPAFFGDRRAATQAAYSRWMARLAATQPNVQVIDWRGAVLDGAVTLPDGSHPDEAGAQYRAKLTLGAVRAALRG